MKIYLVRHPETIANRDGIVYGWMDYPYTEVGQEMARRIPSYFRGLEIDAVYSSPLGRARRLAEGIGQETGRSVQTDDRLKEMNFGVLEGTFSTSWIRASGRSWTDCLPILKTSGFREEKAVP